MLKITVAHDLPSTGIPFYMYLGVAANTPASGSMVHNNFRGWVSEFRVSTVARWTDTFTPATAAYGTDSSTWALLHFAGNLNDACSNTTWIAKNIYTPTFNTANRKFDCSLYFDRGAQLRSESIILGGADFTIDGWTYMSSSSGAHARMFEYILTPGTGNHGILFYRNNTNSQLYLTVWNSANASGSLNVNIPMNAWFHWALVQEYSAGTVKLYINGTYLGTIAKVIDRIPRIMVLGRSSWWSDGYFVGYHEYLRITDGVARWTKNFIPPERDPCVKTVTSTALIQGANIYSPTAEGKLTTSTVSGNTNIVTAVSGTIQRNAVSSVKTNSSLVTQHRDIKQYYKDVVAIIVPIPKIKNIVFDYNAAAQGPILEDCEYDKVTVTNFVASAPGTYELTCHLNNTNYVWSDGTKSDKVYSWKINTTVSLSATDTITLNPSVNKATFTYTAPVSSYGDTFQNVTVSSNNTAVCTVELSGTTITVWRKGTGSATITLQGVMNGYTHKITRAVTVSAIDDATVSYMKFDNAASPITDLVSANTWVPYGFQAVYYGQTLANTSQNFDLTKDWSVSFDYRYVSGGGGDWNCVFSFGHTINIHGNDTHIQIFYGYSTGTYSATYNATDHTLTTIVNGTTTVTENYTRTETSYNGFYVGAGGQWRNHTFYCTNFTIRAYLADATTQSTGTYNFAAGTLEGTGDIKIDVFRSGGIRAIDNIKYVGTTNAINGYSLSFPSGAYLLSNNTVPIADTDFTVEYWGYMSSSSGSYAGFFLLSPSNNGAQAWNTACRIAFERLQTTDNFTLDVLGSNSSPVYTDNTSFNCSGLLINKLHHYAFVYNSTTKTLYFYLDGVLKFSKGSCTIPSAARYMFIGNSNTQNFVGQIDEFRISNFIRYNGNFTPLTTAYDLVGPSTIVTVPSGNVGYTGSPVQPAYNTDTTVVDSHSNIEVLGGNKTATYRLKDTVNTCWPDGTIAPKVVTYAITTGTKDANYYDTRCTKDLGSISANTVVDLSTLPTAGQNEFEYADNTFRSGPSSYNVNNGQSNYWIKVTPTVNMTVNVTAQLGSEGSWDFGLISVATSRSIPGRGAGTITNGSIIMNGSGVIAKNTWSYNMTAGTTYWVGFHYAKDGSVNSNGDRLWIHGVNFTVTGSAISDAVGNIWNFTGSPSIQTDVTKFGSAVSIPYGSYLILPNFTLGGADFTVDSWAYVSSSSGSAARIFEWYGSVKLNIEVTPNQARAHGPRSSCYATSGTISNAWHHFAVVYQHSTTTTTLYVDGTAVGSGVDTIGQATAEMLIGGGRSYNAYYFVGYIDEFRISNVARWTADFTPPTGQYGYDANTVVLLHF